MKPSALRFGWLVPALVGSVPVALLLALSRFASWGPLWSPDPAPRCADVEVLLRGLQGPVVDRGFPAMSFEAPLVDLELPDSVRAWLALQLARLDDPAATDLLLRALDDPSVVVVRAAVAALGERDDPRAREALVAHRTHPDPEVSRLLGEILRSGSKGPAPRAPLAEAPQPSSNPIR